MQIISIFIQAAIISFFIAAVIWILDKVLSIKKG